MALWGLSKLRGSWVIPAAFATLAFDEGEPPPELLLPAAPRAIVLPAAPDTDELSAAGFGNTGGLAPDLWQQKSNNPRIENLYADEVIIAHVTITSADDDLGSVVYSIRPTVALQEFYQTDEIVAQPVPLSPDEDAWVRPYVVPRVASFPAADVQDEITPVAVSYGDTGGLAPDLWAMASSSPRIAHLFADDAIVPQPTPFSIEEGVWVAPYVIPPARSLEVQQAQDERVAPSASIALDDGGDSSPFFNVAGNVWMPVPWQFASEGSVWSPITEDYQLVAFDLPRRAVVTPQPTADEVIVTAAAPLQVDELYWQPSIGIAERLRDVVTVSDEVIVPQPAPFGLDELTWHPVVGIVQQPRDLIVASDEVIVPQPALLQVDESDWQASPVVQRHQAVILSSDEVIVPQPIHVDELYWYLEANRQARAVTTVESTEEVIGPPGGIPLDTTTIYGPFQTLADRLVISEPVSRVVISDPSHTLTVADPASRLIILSEEP